MLVQSRLSAGAYINLEFRQRPPISTDIREFGCTLAARSEVVSEMSLALYSKKGVELRRSFLLHRWDDVRVGVERDRDRGVTQTLLNHLRVEALGEKERRRGMPQVVEPDLWQPRFLQQRVERSPHQVAFPQWAAVRVAEDPRCRMGLRWASESMARRDGDHKVR